MSFWNIKGDIYRMVLSEAGSRVVLDRRAKIIRTDSTSNLRVSFREMSNVCYFPEMVADFRKQH